MDFLSCITDGSLTLFRLVIGIGILAAIVIPCDRWLNRKAERMERRVQMIDNFELIQAMKRGSDHRE